MTLKHTPYDGSHPLFRIGLEPLDLNDWIEVDQHLDFYLDEKKRLEAVYPNKLFVAEDNTEAAQREALNLITDHLVRHHGDSHRRDGDQIKAGKHSVALNADLPPLRIAAKLVQEDLIVMRDSENGWRLVAASLCFPSSWSLLEKFGKPLDQIHAPVPSFGPGSRNAGLIFRIFDNLKVEQPVRRFNWSIYSDDALFHDDKTAENLQKRDFENGIYLRVEHQTLRKLPKSGDILFTVRIHLDPFERLQEKSDKNRICEGLINSLENLDPDQLDYKGLDVERPRLIQKLQDMIAAKDAGDNV